MTILGVVARYEIVQVCALQRISLQREVLIGAEVVNPKHLSPRSGAGWLAVEEQDVRLHSLGVEDAGRQAQQRVNVGLLEQFAPDRLTGRGGDFMIIDDPLKPDEAASETQRNAVNQCSYGWRRSTSSITLNSSGRRLSMVIFRALCSAR